MNGSEGPKRSAARQRLLLGGALAAGLGVLGLTGTASPSGGVQRSATIVGLEASRAVPRTFPSSTPSSVAQSTDAAATTAAVAAASAAAAPSTTVPAGPPAAAAPPAASTPAEPAPSPTPTAGPATGSVEEAIATYFGDVYDQAVGVARCESSLDPNAVSSGGANWGLFQINTVHEQRVADMGYSWDQILDPYVNAAVARSIYDDAGGWGPWGCRRAAY